MSKKNVFVASSKVIGMGQGNIDFFKSTVAFREKAQMFADGLNKLNDKSRQYKAVIEAEQKSLDFYLKSPMISSTEVEAREQRIADLEAELKVIKEAIREAMPTWDEFDDNLFYAYRTFILGEEDTTSANTYKRAMMEWLDANGMEPSDKGIKFITSQIGAKKASSTTLYKSGGKQFTDNMNKNQYLDMVYRVVAQMMYKVGALKEYTYEYVAETKKVEKVAKAK